MLVYLVYLLLCLFSFGCGLYSQESGQEQEAPTPRAILDANIYTSVRGSNNFGFELYSLLKQNPGNLCFSPYSLSEAMAMPFTGSKGSTQVEIRAVMHYLNLAKEQNEVFQWLDTFYETPWYLGPNECRLFLGNSLWIQRDFPLIKSYSDRINLYFGRVLKTTDFSRNPEGARYNMNAWLREKAQGRISQVIQKEDVAGKPRMLLASSAFLKGVWSSPFNPALTKETPFFINKNTTVSVNMMTISGRFNIFKGTDIMALELPYRSGYQGNPYLSLIIVLPQSNFDLASIEQKFYYDNWLGWISQMREGVCIVSVPRFTLAQSFDMTPLFLRMGMTLTFSDMADFSDISTREGLALKKVLHSAYLSVDEKGSDAVSANPLAVSDTTAGFSQEATIFKADHPFLFAVVDKSKGTLLYLGRYSVPNQIKKE